MPTDGLPYQRTDDGKVWCINCHKYADDSHVSSNRHKWWKDYHQGRQAPQQLAQAALQYQQSQLAPQPPRQLGTVDLQQRQQLAAVASGTAAGSAAGDWRPPLAGPPPGEPQGLQEGTPPQPWEQLQQIPLRQQLQDVRRPPPRPAAGEPSGFQEGPPPPPRSLADLEARLMTMEAKLVTMQDTEARLTTLEAKFTTMEAKLSTMEAVLTTMFTKEHELEDKVTTLNVINTWQDHKHTWVNYEDGSNSWHWGAWNGDDDRWHISWQEGPEDSSSKSSKASGSHQPWSRSGDSGDLW